MRRAAPGGAQVFALHPLYLSLRALAPSGCPPETTKKIEEARARLNLPDVDYEGALAAKLEIAREIFEHRGRQELEVRGRPAEGLGPLLDSGGQHSSRPAHHCALLHKV